MITKYLVIVGVVSFLLLPKVGYAGEQEFEPGQKMGFWQCYRLGGFPNGGRCFETVEQSTSFFVEIRRELRKRRYKKKRAYRMSGRVLAEKALEQGEY